MDEKTFLEVIQPRFWYIGQDGLWIWRYNVLRAMANSGDKKYHEYIKEAMKDSDHNIRDMAVWACQKLEFNPNTRYSINVLDLESKTRYSINVLDFESKTWHLYRHNGGVSSSK